MSHLIHTSARARDFAERLLRESPIEGNASKGCGAGCSDEHSHEHDGPEEHSSCGRSHDRSKERELFERSTSEKYRACMIFREEAKVAFAAEQYAVACGLYEKILIHLDYTFPEDDEWKAKFRELEQSTNMNLALARFRLGEYRQSIIHCNRVLSSDELNVKALVRRGLCHLSLCAYSDAERVSVPLHLHSVFRISMRHWRSTVNVPLPASSYVF